MSAMLSSTQAGTPCRADLLFCSILPHSIDSGLGDNFYQQKQLLPEDFQEAARKSGHGEDEVNIRLQDDYDHSCESEREPLRDFSIAGDDTDIPLPPSSFRSDFFISTYAPEHIRWHAKFLK